MISLTALTERERVRWNVAETSAPIFSPSAAVVADLLESRTLTAHFQPIFNTRDGRVYGCEALARIPAHLAPDGPGPLFAAAREFGLVAALDRLCRQKALESALAQQWAKGTERLFINVCPETLMDEDILPFADKVAELGLERERIVFEITEESAVTDYDLFARAVAFYRDQGFKIAIDDFGVGYGGLKMLAVIEPDFVKIDRHFVQNIERALVRRNLVDSITTACHRLGIKVIAEGIETEADAAVLQNMGVEFLQGFWLARPHENWPAPQTTVALPRGHGLGFEFGETLFIGEIAHPAPTLPPSASMAQARQIFIENAALSSIPIVEGARCLGMLHRKTFFEKQLSGPLGYGSSLSTYKTVLELSQSVPHLCVEANETLEDVARSLRGREQETRYDDICITSNGKYRGVVAISSLLDAITQRSLNLARGSNPLSGLPGNEVIRNEIEKRIAQTMHFDVCYLDIDNFKPFNDTYGFNSGDTAIRRLATIVTDTMLEIGDPDDFAGHIGGDDFLLIARPGHSQTLCRAIIEKFEAALPDLHGTKDFERGHFEATNRRGEREQFPLMALSIGVVSTEVQFFQSVAELSSVASEVKKAAKAASGSAIVRDRRLCG